MGVVVDMFNADSDGKPFKAGDVVFSAGDRGVEMYVILEGEVEVKVGSNYVEVLGPGEPFGEMALIDNSPRNATATAKTACKVVPISEKRFLELIQDTPYFGLQIMQVMAHRLRKMGARA